MTGDYQMSGISQGVLSFSLDVARAKYARTSGYPIMSRFPQQAVINTVKVMLNLLELEMSGWAEILIPAGLLLIKICNLHCLCIQLHSP